jgi:hypothetical protein
MFKLSTSDRLGRWKQFRTEINGQMLPEAMESTVDFWHPCPFTPFYLDAENPDNWPDPWQLITENYYCDLAKALGILYTLHLSKHAPLLNPEIRVYYDSISRHSYHIVWIDDGKYVINMVESDVVNKEQINQRLQLKYRYTATDLKLDQL